MKTKETKTEQPKTLTVIKKEVEGIKTMGRFHVTSKPTYDTAKEFLGNIRTAKGMIKTEYREKIIEPAYRAYKNASDMIAPYEKDLKIVEDYLKGEMTKYDNKLQAEAEEAKKKLEDSLKNGEISEEKAIAQIDKISAKEEYVSNVREYPEVVIDDKSKIPLEYLEPATSRILKDLQSGKTIPGARIEMRKSVSNNF